MDSRALASRRPVGEAEGEPESLGRRLKALRTEHGVTLAQLGSMVGLSASYLSQIERNKAQPSLTTLSSVADKLGVEMRFFFEGSTPVWQVVRNGTGKEFSDETGKATFEILSSGAVRGKFEPYRITCQPSTTIDEDTHPGEELIFILEGQLEVSVGEEVFPLTQGDSIHYQGSQPHAWRNVSGRECCLLWALSPPVVPSRGSEEGG
jgi:quercetin dioxygenase-like cupin family protein/DNA-binding phage protein